MSAKPQLPATQRAYTLRLTSSCEDWRGRLWRTHVAVNRGATAFGDWLLTLRGGLAHALADLPQPSEKEILDELDSLNKAATKENRPEPAQEDAQRSLAEKRAARIAERRVLLALSWLTVEVGYSGPHRLDASQTVPALRLILQQRGLDEAGIADWVCDCEASLRAKIKEGATWVNRSAAFDAAVAEASLGPTITREEIWDLLLPFFTSISAYLEPIDLSGDADSVGGDAKAKDLVQKAGQWLSSRFGTGKGADFTQLGQVYRAMTTWTQTAPVPISGADFITRLAEALAKFSPAEASIEAILSLISGPGYKSATRNLVKSLGAKASVSAEDMIKFAEVTAADAGADSRKVGGKGQREWSNRLLRWVEACCGFTYLGLAKSGNENAADKHEAARHSEFAVLLDHAARRVSLAHTWGKRAEAERRQFTVDASKLAPLRAQHPAAVHWLDDFCARRSDSSQAEDAYRIRPRALGGWKEVVAEWCKPGCRTAEDRIAAARALQDSDQIDKFGDIQLFEALADDDARSVWQDGPGVLLTYAAATDAQHKRERFKVPACCHPDPLRHPVFCDFGNSRWDVDFAFHRRTAQLPDAQQKVLRLREAVAKAEAQHSKAKTDEKRAAKQTVLDNTRRKVVEAERELAYLQQPRALTLTLLDGPTPQPTELRWQSKRLAADLALNGQNDASAGTAPAEVTRATPQGFAAGGVATGTPVRVLGLFDQEHWNCRLQAPREQLDELASYLEKQGASTTDDSAWNERARRLRDRLEWLVTFSAKLQPQGPWLDYVNLSSSKSPFERTIQSGAKKGQKVLSLEGWPHSDENDSRAGRARLILCRLPGLRLLSADLGHRYGAACAVWEALSPADLAALCIKAGVPKPGANALYFQLPCNSSGKANMVILRRIGPDILDGISHPAPWARLERQFLLKLQGEELTPRMASPAELAFVENLEAACGLVPEHRLHGRLAAAREGKDRRPSLDVPDVLGRAVDTLRLALKRHAQRARLARDINNLRPPGIGGKPRATDLQGDDLWKHLSNLFREWHALAYHRKAPDIAARELWKNHLAVTLVEPPEERETKQQQKQREETNANLLSDKVGHWASRDRTVLAVAWQQLWAKADGKPAQVEKRDSPSVKGGDRTRVLVEPTGFHRLLRELEGWLRPRGVRSAAREVRIASRRSGGLSVKRITTLKGFYQLQKAFLGREKFEDGLWRHEDFEAREPAKRTLTALERLREQRVKQLASRLAAAALGLAPAAHTPAEGNTSAKEAGLLARQRLGKMESRFEPCHAVVIENLDNYRPDQLQTRRENRQLMDWSSSKVRKFLTEACQLHGLHLREVTPAYTSRQDSRTGAPGLRCADVPLKEFLRKSGFWQRDAEKIRGKTPGERREAEQLLLDTFDQWQKISAQPTPEQARRLAHGSIRLLRDGADLFVSADMPSPAARGLQADLNAAANIGLKALLDPDCPGSWWFVPCDRRTHMPKPEVVKGCALFEGLTALGQTVAVTAGNGKPRKGEREFVNLWRDVSPVPLGAGTWQESTGYWHAVQQRVAAVLRQHNGLEPEDDVSM